ncbi:GNAT family N-acetyltransferase [Streptomyces sp. NBC_00083]|uniref:GNAT family N-acetyltransferase n=1 Tax=Streptomyces sp. NBC_00083 TaxID=2975647 RepID=UPI0022584856|nr:GNAT family N-acetyltransferase [Streptomyces sp. NBC_00083]MCX5384909.1 GNAT family N-acetyltransferase [Streptomyces sp. NBC_00083]
MSETARELPPQIHLVAWSDGDLGLLRRNNAPEMTEHLGGPETEEKVLSRHAKYTALSARPATEGRMFKVVLADSGEAVGSVGYWPRIGEGEAVYETGYGILPEFRGRGLAVAALRAVVAEARAAGGPRTLHAYPSVDHTASNAICRKAGLTCAGEVAFEYPPGTPLRSNDWWTGLGD